MDQNTGTQIQKHITRRYNILKKVGSGAYGHVWKVQDVVTKKIYALKKIFDAFQHSTDAQRTYRQIQILKQTQHPNIIKLYQTIKAENNKDVYLIFQFMEADLHNVIAEGILKQVHIRFIIYQLAKALKYLHTGSIIHRDLKPSNILINSNCSIKLCDFGLVRSLILYEETNLNLTEGVATRWYRAPQVLLGSKSYSTPADIWSFGCIIYQVLAQKPLFPGNSTSDQIDKILAFTGYPNEEQINSIESEVAKTMLQQSKATSHNSIAKSLLRQFSPMFVDMLQRMLTFNPKKRMTIRQILQHEVIQPFKKQVEQIACNKEIRTSINDNKKLTVDQYRGFVYGTKRPNSVGDSYKTGLGPKKSSSFTKFSSHMQHNQQKQLRAVNKQTLRYVRSAKNVLRSTQSDNKSMQIPHNDNSFGYSKYSQKYEGSIINNNKDSAGDLKDPGRIAFISNKNVYSPKYISNGIQQKKQVGASTTGYNSPKFSYTRQTTTKPLFKSSKYVINKSEASQDK